MLLNIFKQLFIKELYSLLSISKESFKKFFHHTNFIKLLYEISEKLLFYYLSFPRKWESSLILIDSRFHRNDNLNTSEVIIIRKTHDFTLFLAEVT